jgi:RimJ/RimL family protein N-acetyltransferase
MLELQTPEFYTVADLFNGIDHNAALVFSVIEGNSRGRIFVDRPVSPSSVFLLHEGAFSFVGGSPNHSEFIQALEPLIFDDLLPCAKEKELILFAFSEDWRGKLDAQLSRRGVIRIHRKVFTFNPLRFEAHEGWRARLPEGYSIRPIHERLAEAHPEFRPVVEPGAQRFGVCLERGDEIVSACYAVCVGRGEAEIDIFTVDAHQRKGFATLAACAFIEECLSRGLTPNWACWPYREASVALAIKLGFEPKPDVPAHYWAENM